MSTPSRKPTLVIAEAGVNHNGDIERALRLIEVAAKAGADFVKFQSFRASELVTQNAEKASYQQASTGRGTQLDMLRQLELSEADHAKLQSHCEKEKIGFLSTPFDLSSLDLLVEMGVSLLKISSGEITNGPFLRAVAAKKLPIVLSTGMSTLGEVESAVMALGSARERTTLLHCNTEYPTPMGDANIRAMVTLKEAFGLPVGLSDHTLGIEVSVAAVALGARVIEKHFTLDKTLPGPDHAASLEPAQLEALVSAIRNVETALGDGIKRPTGSELANREVARRSVHLSRELPSGHVLQASDLCMKRPGHGISPMLVPQILGNQLRRPMKENELLSWSDLDLFSQRSVGVDD